MRSILRLILILTAFLGLLGLWITTGADAPGKVPRLAVDTFASAVWTIGDPKVVAEKEAGLSAPSPKEGYKLVIVSVSFTFPKDAPVKGEAFLSNQDFIALYSGGESRAFARSLGIADDGTPKFWLLSKDREEAAGATHDLAGGKGGSFGLAFSIPKEINVFEVRFLQPIGVAALKK